MVVVVMGVSGSGKTTIGSQLAQQFGWEFADADDYHTRANVKKMRDGIPLTDADRVPWLDALRSLITGWIHAGKAGVLACSALKQTYREHLRVGEQVRFVYLRTSEDVLSRRLLERHGHYMKRRMLESQLAALEEPNDAVAVNADGAPEKIVHEIRSVLGLV